MGIAGAVEGFVGGAASTAATLSQADLAARQIRFLLADAYGLLEGDRRSNEARTYTLDAAIAAYLELLDGKPRDGIRSRTARLDALLSTLTATLSAAASLDDSMLGSEAVPGVGSSFLSGGVLKNATSGLGDAVSGASLPELSEHMNTAGDPYAAVKGRLSLPDPRSALG